MADTARTLCDCPEPCQVKTACVRKIMTLMATVNDDPAQRYSLLILQRRFLNVVSFWPEIAPREAGPQSCHGGGHVAIKRC